MELALLFLGIAIGGAAGAIWGVLRTEVKYRLEIMKMNEHIKRMVIQALAIEKLLKERQIDIHIIENAMSLDEDVKPTKH